LWTPDEFEKQMVAMQQSASEGPSERNLARVWASGSSEVEIDRQGRMPIPSHLRDFAGLDGDVLVHGAIDRVELWNPTAWDQRVKPMERRLTEGEGEPASG
jgi:MraZ protein